MSEQHRRLTMKAAQCKATPASSSQLITDRPGFRFLWALNTTQRVIIIISCLRLRLR